MSNLDIVERLLYVDTSFCGRSTVQDAVAEIERLQAETKRLRGLLKRCQPYIEDGGDGTGELYAVIDELLCEAVEKKSN